MQSSSGFLSGIPILSAFFNRVKLENDLKDKLMSLKGH